MPFIIREKILHLRLVLYLFTFLTSIAIFRACKQTCKNFCAGLQKVKEWSDDFCKSYDVLCKMFDIKATHLSLS